MIFNLGRKTRGYTKSYIVKLLWKAGRLPYKGAESVGQQRPVKGEGRIKGPFPNGNRICRSCYNLIYIILRT